MHNCSYLTILSGKTITRRDIKQYKQTSIGVNKFLNADHSLCIQRGLLYSQPSIGSFEATQYYLHACIMQYELYMIIQFEKTIARRGIKQYEQISIGVNKFMNAES